MAKAPSQSVASARIATRPERASSSPSRRGPVRAILSLVLFLSVCAGLGYAPEVPDRFRPIDLSTKEARAAVVETVLRKPEMRFASPDMESDYGIAVDDSEPEPDALASVAPNEDDVENDSDDDALRPPEAAVNAADPTSETLVALLNDPERVRAAPRRPGPKESNRSRWLRERATEVEATGAKLKNPCVDGEESSCARRALDGFFSDLDDAYAEKPNGRVAVVTLGNSLIASDHVVDVVRTRLVERFGSRGRGFLLPERLSEVAGRRVRTGTSDGTWRIHTFAQKPPARRHFGFTGSTHESTKTGDRITWNPSGATSMVLYYLDHAENPGFSIVVDDVPVERKAASSQKAATRDRTLEISIPAGARSVSLDAADGGVVLYGASFEREGPGVVVDTIGVPASDSETYVTKADAAIFDRQLKSRDPSLVVVMMGGNEIRSLSFGWTTPRHVEEMFGALLDRIKEAAPEASCLAVAPIDAAKATAAGAQLTTRKEVMTVIDIEERVALQKGCAFFNLFEAMGGENSLHRFRKSGYVHDDLVHPKAKGGDILGQLFADAVFDAYRAAEPMILTMAGPQKKFKPPAVVSLRGFQNRRNGEGGPGTRFATQVQTLRKTKAGRIAVGIFGDESLASPVMVDAFRSQLNEVLGDGGIGFLATGAPDSGLLARKIQRRVDGSVTLRNNVDEPLGAHASVFATAADVALGGALMYEMCIGCSPNGTPGFVDVAWLFEPDMGRAKVLINGAEVGVLAPERRVPTTARTPTVQWTRFAVEGPAFRLAIRGARESELVDNPGEVRVLGVASEFDTGGVVVDGVPLHLGTAMTYQRWHQGALREQVEGRDYSLVVLGYGANESSLEKLDELTYGHHATATVDTLLLGAPAADCVVMLPSSTKNAGPKIELVRNLLGRVADQFRCMRFDIDDVVIAPGVSDDDRNAHIGRTLAADLLALSVDDETIEPPRVSGAEGGR